MLKLNTAFSIGFSVVSSVVFNLVPAALPSTYAPPGDQNTDKTLPICTPRPPKQTLPICTRRLPKHIQNASHMHSQATKTHTKRSPYAPPGYQNIYKTHTTIIIPTRLENPQGIG